MTKRFNNNSSLILGQGTMKTTTSYCSFISDQEQEVYSALEMFERTVELVKEFQKTFGFKLLICVTKICFSIFLTFRLIILVLRGEDGEDENRPIFNSALLHMTHISGLMFLISLINQVQKMAQKVFICRFL
jgi:hypothetical protein